MWIVSEFGLINTDNITCILYQDNKTVAYDAGYERYTISHERVVADILVALQTGREFLEVK